jgi:hypothetical protein
MGSAGSGLFEQVLQALRQALSLALSEVFLIGLFMLIVAFIVNLLIREIPLRKHHTTDAVSPQNNGKRHVTS